MSPARDDAVVNDDAQYQYVTGQMRPSFPALLADYEARSNAAIGHCACTFDIRYGVRPREVFDFFPAEGTARATLAYFHAGYWQSRDKSTFRWLAPMFTPRGFDVALVNYPLCPSVTVGEIVDAAEASVRAIRAHSAHLGRSDAPLIVSGHSAGAHLATELGLVGLADAVIALSGIYDLTPLVGTTLNENLRLDASSAQTLSPLYRVSAGAPPAMFIVGGDETPAFIDQNRRMYEAWRADGNVAEKQVVAGADHFSVLTEFAAPVGRIANSIEAFARRRPASR